MWECEPCAGRVGFVPMWTGLDFFPSLFARMLLGMLPSASLAASFARRERQRTQQRGCSLHRWQEQDIPSRVSGEGVHIPRKRAAFPPRPPPGCAAGWFSLLAVPSPGRGCSGTAADARPPSGCGDPFWDGCARHGMLPGAGLSTEVAGLAQEIKIIIIKI